MSAKKICIVGGSGKLGQYLVNQALDQGQQVVVVCREQSVAKLAHLADKITIFAGKTDDRQVIEQAVKGCDAVLTVLAPWGMQHYASGTAQAVLDFAEPGARLIFSCGWHISKDGNDDFSWQFRCFILLATFLMGLFRVADINDQVEACRRIMASDSLWTIVRGSDLEEGASQGLPIWREYVGDPALASNLTRRADFALFMLAAIDDEGLIRQVPAICGCATASAIAAQANAEVL